MFRDREEAGKALGKKVLDVLSKSPGFSRANTVVVGLPCGGVPVAKEVASILGCPLTIVVSKKIGAPLQHEVAIGAVSSSGDLALSEFLGDIIKDLHPWIESKKLRLTETARTLEANWVKATGISDRKIVKDKLAVLVDDGIATGMTVLAAIKTLRTAGANQVIVATPVTPRFTADYIEQKCDKLISLLMPEEFWTVGMYYQRFEQVENDQMVAILKQFALAEKALV